MGWSKALHCGNLYVNKWWWVGCIQFSLTAGAKQDIWSLWHDWRSGWQVLWIFCLSTIIHVSPLRQNFSPLPQVYMTFALLCTVGTFLFSGHTHVAQVWCHCPPRDPVFISPSALVDCIEIARSTVERRPAHVGINFTARDHSWVSGLDCTFLYAGTWLLFCKLYLRYHLTIIMSIIETSI